MTTSHAPQFNTNLHINVGLLSCHLAQNISDLKKIQIYRYEVSIKEQGIKKTCFCLCVKNGISLVNLPLKYKPLQLHNLAGTWTRQSNSLEVDLQKVLCN